MCKPRKAEPGSVASGEAAAAAAAAGKGVHSGQRMVKMVSSRSQTLLALILMSKEVTSLPRDLVLVSPQL